MIGATVQVKGTYNGTMTGLDGEYELNNVASDGVLIFSTIGYETVEVNINGRNTINVVMEESTERCSMSLWSWDMEWCKSDLPAPSPR